MIRALQVSRYVWKIYSVDDDGKVDIWTYRGQVQRGQTGYYAMKAITAPQHPNDEPRLLHVDHSFHTLAEAAEHIA